MKHLSVFLVTLVVSLSALSNGSSSKHIEEFIYQRNVEILNKIEEPEPEIKSSEDINLWFNKAVSDQNIPVDSTKVKK